MSWTYTHIGKRRKSFTQRPVLVVALFIFAAIFVVFQLVNQSVNVYSYFTAIKPDGLVYQSTEYKDAVGFLFETQRYDNYTTSGSQKELAEPLIKDFKKMGFNLSGVTCDHDEDSYLFEKHYNNQYQSAGVSFIHNANFDDARPWTIGCKRPNTDYQVTIAFYASMNDSGTFSD